MISGGDTPGLPLFAVTWRGRKGLLHGRHGFPLRHCTQVVLSTYICMTNVRCVREWFFSFPFPLIPIPSFLSPLIPIMVCSFHSHSLPFPCGHSHSVPLPCPNSVTVQQDSENACFSNKDIILESDKWLPNSYF